MSDMIISDIDAYRAGRAQGASDGATGAPYAAAYPRYESDSYVAGWMAGYQSAGGAR